MTRKEYLEQLRALLTGRVPAEELEHMLAYYEEYFDEAGADGEQRVIAELGTPAELVSRVLGEQRAKSAPQESDPFAKPVSRQGGGLWKVLLAVCAAPVAIPLLLVVLALAALAVILVAGLVIGVVVGGVALIGMGIVTACAGISVLFTAGLPTVMFFCGMGLLASGVGLLLIAGGFLLGGLCLRGLTAALGRWLHRKEARA
ncbi:DUF1700 domain-containing protein [Flavonifractor hominis]|uniref:DUF1700 domain-containing protein n=1 Tax=Flavonifractor hominis TaxID=3133178 RepID=A0ABV1ENV0_9FIRM